MAILDTDGLKVSLTVLQWQAHTGVNDIIWINAANPTDRVDLKLADAGAVDFTNPLVGRSADIEGSSGNDTITAGAGNDYLDGGEGTDILNGGNGNDTLYGGLGDDTLNGGEGDDRFFINEAGNNSFNGGDGTDTLIIDSTSSFLIDISLDTISGIEILDTENYFVTATAIQLSGFSTIRTNAVNLETGISLQIAGIAGITDIAAAVGAREVTIIGTAAADTITTGEGDDNIDGGNGADTLNGGLGNDILDGGSGDDTLNGGEGDERFDAGEIGNDTFNGGGGADTLIASQDDISLDTISGIEILETAGFSTKATASQLNGFSIIRTDAANPENGIVLFLGGPAGTTNIAAAVEAREVTIVGTSASDTITTGEGDDKIYGEIGSDTLNGGAGADTINGGEGTDILDGGAGDDVINGGEGIDTINGGADNDLINGDGGNDILNGGEGDDVFEAEEDGNNTFNGGEGIDKLLVSSFENISLDTMISVEILETTGAEVKATANQFSAFSTIRTNVASISGNITLELTGVGSTTNIAAAVGENNVYITGTDLNDTIITGAGNDEIEGNGGKDTLDGGAGNDTLNGGIGNDILNGGEGDDQFNADEDGNDTFNGGSGIDTIQVGSFDNNISLDIMSGIEILEIDGRSVTATASQFSAFSTLRTTGFDSTGDLGLSLAGLAGITNVAAAVGTRNVRIAGTEGADTITTGAGNDILEGYEGDDVLNGGDGNDTFIAEPSGRDTFNGGNGIDTLQADLDISLNTISGMEILETNSNRISATASQLDGFSTILTRVNNPNDGVSFQLTGPAGVTNIAAAVGARDVNIIGTRAADAITTGSGNDTINGGAGADTMTGEKGNDIYFVSNTLDKVIESSGSTGGIDTVKTTLSTYILGTNIENLTANDGDNFTGTGNSLDNVITGNSGKDTLIGSSGRDTLNGGSNTDMLFGGSFSDFLDGGSSADTLYGGTGNDRLTGGTGADTFVFDSTLNASTNVDRITDFQAGVDNIFLAQAIFKDLGATLSSSEFQIGNAANSSTDRIIYNKTTGELFYDSNGNGSGGQILFARVTAGTALTLGDFDMIA